MTYTDYLFLKHRMLVVLRRVFPDANLQLTEDKGYGFYLHISVQRGGRNMVINKTLSKYQLNSDFYLMEILRHGISSLTSILMEATWLND